MTFYPKRKVFISYYHGDQTAVNKFVQDFSDVFIAKTVGVKDGDFDFDSTNPQYIMRKIRENKLQDSTVTIVLAHIAEDMLTGKLKHPFSKVSHHPMGLLQSISPIWGAKVHYLNVFLKMS